nr:hypothetical protein [Tanacetum cinerariifolium]
MVEMTAPFDQVPEMAPPVRTDDQLLLRIRAFTASPTILSIYIQLHTTNIQEASYYQEYQANVAKHRRKGYRIYNKRTRRIMETIHVQFDELTEPMAPVQLNTRLVPMFMTPGQISSGLIPNPVPAVPYVPPTNKDLEILFQSMFDEYLEPLRVERPVSPASAVPVPVNSAGTPSSTTIVFRKQLATDALWCFYNSVLSKVEAKNFKSAITEDCWF